MISLSKVCGLALAAVPLMLSVSMASPIDRDAGAKIRGDFRNEYLSQRYARQSRSYSMPAYRSAPAVVAQPAPAPEPSVARANSGTRRFSYEGSANAGGAQASQPAMNAGPVYSGRSMGSYAPRTRSDNRAYRDAASKAKFRY